jgi:hypothetical protein
MVEKTISALLKLLLPLIMAVCAVFSLSWNVPSTQRTGEAARTEIAAHFTSRRWVAFHQPKSFIAWVDFSADHFYQSLFYQRLITITLDQQRHVAQVLQKPFLLKTLRLLPSDDGDLHLA